MNVTGIKDKIIEVISPVLDKHYIKLVDIEFKSRNGQKVVTFFIDKDEGVNLVDCTNLSSTIGDILDVEDLIPYSYILEVSSPGLDRPLTKKTDFERHVGKEINLYLNDENDRRFMGIIKDVKVNSIEFETSNDIIEIPFSKIIKGKHIISTNNVN